MKLKFLKYLSILPKGNKKLRLNYLLSISFFIFQVNAYSQERLEPLHYNKQLFETKDNIQDRSTAYPDKIFFIIDTLNLPFYDDFSSNKFQTFYYYSFPNSAINSSSIFNFTLKKLVSPFIQSNPTSFNYSKVRQYDSTFVSSGNWSRTVTDSFNISFQNLYNFQNKIKSYPQSPFIADSTFKVWLGGVKLDSAATVAVSNIDATIKSISQLTETFEVVKIQGSGQNGLWSDFEQNVFLNNTFPIAQPTIGVATFDGLNHKGMPYNFSIVSNGRADYLTSKPLNLNFATPRYLSFFWQRQGLGDTPEFTDSLMLQFRNAETDWQTIWSKTGGVSDTTFTSATIGIDSIYLSSSFQFRFINRATLSGANDHWNIDYVRVVQNLSDTIINDLAFVSGPTTFLKEYQSVPYSQYVSSMMSSNITNYIHNLSPSSLGQNTNFDYQVSDFYSQNLIDIVNVDNFNFAAAEINNCNFCASVLNPLLITGSHPQFFFPDSNKCVEYRIKQWLTPLNLAPIRENDTIQFIQRFSDYFAYDDGSAEAGYLLTTPAANMAAQFELTSADEMRGMKIFFDPINDNFSGVEFYIRVWSDSIISIGSTTIHIPGKILKEFGPLTPQYTNTNDYSVFAEYLFNSILTLPVGKFYAGIYKESTIGLNIGFDRNNNNQTKMFFTPTSGLWANTQFEGTYMMRPIFGNCTNGLPSKINEIQNNAIQIIPNPASDRVIIKSDLDENLNIEIIDFSGKLLFAKCNIFPGTSVDVEALNNGLYIARIFNSDNQYLKSIKFSIIK